MNADRLQVIKARLEALRGIRPNAIKIPATEYEILQVMNNAYSDLRDLITALEAAQERIATLEAEVQRVTSDHQYIIGHNAGFDDAWAQRGKEIATLEAQRDALRDVDTAAEYVASDRHAHNFAVYQAKRDIARRIGAL